MSTPTQNRRPAGSPAGGQFAPSVAAESEIDLGNTGAPVPGGKSGEVRDLAAELVATVRAANARREAELATKRSADEEPDSVEEDEEEDEEVEECAAPDCEESLDDGEGWNGFCGHHADLIANHEEGDHDGTTSPDCPECPEPREQEALPAGGKVACRFVGRGESADGADRLCTEHFATELDHSDGDHRGWRDADCATCLGYR